MPFIAVTFDQYALSASNRAIMLPLLMSLRRDMYSQGHKGQDKGEAGDGEPAALLGPHAEHHELSAEDDDFLHHRSTEFEEQFWCCRADLRRATRLVGAEYPDHIHAEHLADFDKATGGKDLDYKGPMIMKPMVDLEEAPDSTIKCI